MDDPTLTMTSVYRLVDGSLENVDRSFDADPSGVMTRPSSGASVARLCDWSATTPFRAMPKFQTPAGLPSPRQRATSRSRRPGSSSSRTRQQTVREMLSCSWSPVGSGADTRGANYSGRMFLTAKSGNMTKGEREIINGICQNRGAVLQMQMQMPTMSKTDVVDRMLKAHSVASHTDAWQMGTRQSTPNLNLNHNSQEWGRPLLLSHSFNVNQQTEGRVLTGRPTMSSPGFVQDRPRLICKQCMPSSRPTTTKHRPGYQHIDMVLAPPSSPESEIAPLSLALGNQLGQETTNAVPQSDGRSEDEQEAHQTEKTAASDVQTESSQSTCELPKAVPKPPSRPQSGSSQRPSPTNSNSSNPSSPRTVPLASLRLTHAQTEITATGMISSLAASGTVQSNRQSPVSGTGSDVENQEPQEGRTVVSELRDPDSPDATSRKVLNVYLPRLPGMETVTETDDDDEGFSQS